MPPSGYTKEQSDFLIAFLRSVSVSLKKEGRLKGLSAVSAIESECDNIRLIASKSDCLAEKSILLLTEAFYSQVLSKNPSSYDEYENTVNAVLDEFNNTILSIHVPELEDTISPKALTQP